MTPADLRIDGRFCVVRETGQWRTQMVAEAVTAAEVDPGTAAAVEQAPPVEVDETTPPETELAPEPETAGAPAPETEPDPLASVDRERLLSHPDVRAEIARETEIVRRKSERDTEARVNDARTNWVASGQAIADISTAIEEGDAQRATTILNAALANRDWAAAGVVDRIGRAKLPEGKIAVEDIDRLNAALDAARRGGGLEDYVDTLIEVRAKAYAENVLAPQYETRWQQEQQRKAAAAAKTQQVKSAEAASAGQGRPTLGVPGAGAAVTGITPEELDAIPNDVFARKPLAEQERLINEARANAARVR